MRFQKKKKAATKANINLLQASTVQNYLDSTNQAIILKFVSQKCYNTFAARQLHQFYDRYPLPASQILNIS